MSGIQVNHGTDYVDIIGEGGMNIRVGSDELPALMVALSTHTGEGDATYREAAALALSMCQRHHPDVFPHFRVLDDTRGAISQISNMVAGMNDRLAIPAPCNKWNPIKTAPRDGSCVILFSESASLKFEQWAVAYRHGDDYWQICGEYGGPEAETVIVPTHWMPLSSPHSSEGAGE